VPILKKTATHVKSVVFKGQTGRASLTDMGVWVKRAPPGKLCRLFRGKNLLNLKDLFCICWPKVSGAFADNWMSKDNGDWRPQRANRESGECP
jgi:hypothetical protein